MAQMIPDHLPPQHSTDGERLVFKYLRQLLPDDFYVYVEPDVRTSGRRKTSQPDFVVFGPLFGLLVLEVKDWTLSQIKEADTHKVSIAFSRRGEAQTITNPRRKVRSYCYEVLDQLKKQSILTQQGGPHKGQFCAPFGWAVVFTNIDRCDIDGHAGLSQLFPPEYTLCRDELNALWKERTDRNTIKRLSQFLAEFPFDPITDEQTRQVDYVLSSRWSIQGLKDRFIGREQKRPTKEAERAKVKPVANSAPKSRRKRVKKVEHPLTHDQVQTVRGVIHPESVVRSSTATRQSVPRGWSLPKDAQRLEVLTAEQEQQARAIGPGHRVFFGVAGSGKTILLLARAKQLAANDPDSRILVVCFNNTLLSFLKQCLKDYENIEVQTIVGWLHRRYKFKHEKVENLDWSYMEKNRLSTESYDSILIDEAHDFEPVWFRAIVDAVDGESDGDLLIAVDGSQSLYNRPRGFTWKSVGIRAQGRRTKRLSKNYRNTKEIFEFAWQLTQGPVQDDDVAEINETHVRVQPEEIQRSGSLPRYLRSSSFSSRSDAIAAALNDFRKRGFADSDIGIICAAPSSLRGEIGTAIHRLKTHYGRRIKTAYATSQGSKRNVIQKNAVSILSFHSAKGLEFPAVLVLDCERYMHSWAKGLSPNLLYVAMTRAIHELVLCWDGACWFEEQLADNDWFRQKICPF